MQLASLTYPDQIDLVQAEVRDYLHCLFLSEELYLRGVHNCC